MLGVNHLKKKFKIEILDSSDSVFSSDSGYGFLKSKDALEPFIWPKTGLGQPTQFEKL